MRLSFVIKGILLISRDIKVAVTQKLSNRIEFAIARFHGIRTLGLKQVKICYQYGEKNSKWPKKYKILRKMVITRKLSNKM